MTHNTTPGRGVRPASNNAYRGDVLENLVLISATTYAANRRALIHKTNLAAKIHVNRRDGSTKAVAMKSRPDFEGMVTTLGGRFISFDAKMTASLTYRHSNERLHQLVDLWDVEEYGGIAFLLVFAEILHRDAMRQPDLRCFLLWPQLSWRDARPYSIRLDKLGEKDGIEIPVGSGYGLPDWLSAVERIYGEGGQR
jgi:penicillin-binding protein-related factor A (putative recombinase)